MEAYKPGLLDDVFRWFLDRKTRNLWKMGRNSCVDLILANPNVQKLRALSELGTLLMMRHAGGILWARGFG